MKRALHRTEAHSAWGLRLVLCVCDVTDKPREEAKCRSTVYPKPRPLGPGLTVKERNYRSEIQAVRSSYIWEGSTCLQGGGQGKKDEVGFWVIQGNEEHTRRWQGWA